jgi:pimeloyl-ACP methyl ester carboxylesterase
VRAAFIPPMQAQPCPELQFSDVLACLAVTHACMLDALDAKVCATASTHHSTLQRLHQLALHAHGLDSPRGDRPTVAGVPGDFWHARGALPVVALNSVLEQFREWTQPTLMLVGNHDQVRHPSLPHCLALPVR